MLSLNYTRGFSETTYHYYRKERQILPGRPPRTIYSIIDTTRTGRMPGQAAHVFNMTIGFDYRGFSARLSYLYQSDIASWVNPREPLNDVFVGPYSRFDLSVRQKIGTGMELYANFNNLNNRPDEQYTGQNTQDPDYSFTRRYLPTKNSTAIRSTSDSAIDSEAQLPGR
ncbi:TonB-dependent receptor [Rhodothermus marinus]|uniref:TonB-dependent receptor n=1 Tax=Rhodothermus marinus TaxID=29549 RepID=UPI000A5E5DD1|nr:TonB-dependent receptor [Rhodothermus marinus]